MTQARIASPAEIIQKILVEDGVGVLPGVEQRRFTGPPQVFSHSLADEIDYAISAVDGTGYVFARSMRTGHHDRHRGVNMHVRAPAPDSFGHNLTERIYKLLAEVKNRTVLLFGTNHHIHNIYHVGDFTRVGEQAERRRFEWMWRSRLVFESRETTTPEC
jgi:hypothetical protein